MKYTFLQKPALLLCSASLLLSLPACASKNDHNRDHTSASSYSQSGKSSYAPMDQRTQMDTRSTRTQTQTY